MQFRRTLPYLEPSQKTETFRPLQHEETSTGSWFYRLNTITPPLAKPHQEVYPRQTRGASREGEGAIGPWNATTHAGSSCGWSGFARATLARSLLMSDLVVLLGATGGGGRGGGGEVDSISTEEMVERGRFAPRAARTAANRAEFGFSLGGGRDRVLEKWRRDVDEVE